MTINTYMVRPEYVFAVQWDGTIECEQVMQELCGRRTIQEYANGYSKPATSERSVARFEVHNGRAICRAVGVEHNITYRDVMRGWWVVTKDVDKPPNERNFHIYNDADFHAKYTKGPTHG